MSGEGSLSFHSLLCLAVSSHGEKGQGALWGLYQSINSMREDSTHVTCSPPKSYLLIPFQRELGFKTEFSFRPQQVVSIHSPQPENKRIIFLFHVLLPVMGVTRNLKLKNNQKCFLWYHWGTWKYKRLRVWRDLRDGISHHHCVRCHSKCPGPGVSTDGQKEHPSVELHPLSNLNCYFWHCLHGRPKDRKFNFHLCH